MNIIPEGTVQELVALGIVAEDPGFERCGVYDEGLATRDVCITRAAIAAATSTLELGTGITNPYTRHPATTAMATVTLDEMSGGRAFLGIGAGGSLTLDPLGIERRVCTAERGRAPTRCGSVTPRWSSPTMLRWSRPSRT